VGSEDDVFPAGIVDAAGTRVGVLRISVFLPHSSPQLCRSAVKELNLRADQACDDRCKDAVLTRSYDRLTTSLENQLRALQAEGAQQLLVDITGNGGGSEWAEAAARMLSPQPLLSKRMGFVRGEHWAKHWRDLASLLRSAAKTATPADRAQLAAWAAEADSARQEAEKSCAGQPDCEWLGRAGFSTGLVGRAAAGTFDGKPWGVHVFSPAQYPYHDGVWQGPVIVLVDQHTGSAAEQFTAVLQDNGAAIVMGARTGGGGCGYTNGGTPTTLANSRAILRLPDCARFGADGSNEVNGVIPDVVVGMHGRDTAKFKARLVQAKLPEAVQFANKALPSREPTQDISSRN
jgi:C-terminal processing protease CtpA/Prc